MEKYTPGNPGQRRVRQTVDGFFSGPPASPQRVSLDRLRSSASPTPLPAVVPQQRLQPVANRPAGPLPPTRRRLPQLDMALPESSAKPAHHTEFVHHANRWAGVRKWSFRTVIATLVLIIGVGGFLLSQGYLNLHKIFQGSAASAAALQTNVDPNLLKGEGDGRVNVLLLGVGGSGHDGADLTDTMMLASIDPVNHQATLLSMPRDLWITMSGKGSMKINAAYETGKYGYLHKITADNSNSKAVQAGFDSADQVVESVLGVPINYNFLVDFQAFKQAVDTVGGVNVNVPTELYDPTMAWENHNNPVLAKPGQQHFSGQQALIYVRSRETSSDFARAQRQRSVLLALKDKAVSLGVLSNPAKLSGLMSAFGNNVQTDLSLSDGNRLYSLFKGISNNNIKSVSLAGDTTIDSSAAGADSLVTTGDINGQSVVEPKAGLNDYSAIQAYVHSQLPDGYLLKEHAKVDVLNGTSWVGLATKEAAVLKSYGYNVGTVANAPTKTYNQTVLVDLTHGKDKYTKHYLEQRFNVTATTKLPDTAIAPDGANFILVLGSDETDSL